jgi:SAM-dependent methyltransferase
VRIVARMPTSPTYSWDGDLGRAWARRALLTDAAFEPFGVRAMDALEWRPGMRVLDVGSGCGATTLELARRVGERGEVVGVDISTPMVELARRRAAAFPQVRFDVADAATAELDGPFDAVFSRFGVMFFAEPVVAFTNVRRSLRAGARLSFVCWQERAENPWQLVPYEAAQAHLELPLPTPPRQPGGSAFAEPDYVHEVLGAAGFSDVAVTPFVTDMVVPGGTDLDAVVEAAVSLHAALASAFRSASPDDRARAATAIRRSIEPFATERGYCLGAAMWIVTATA